jgi:hypothetical protein
MKNYIVIVSLLCLATIVACTSTTIRTITADDTANLTAGRTVMLDLTKGTVQYRIDNTSGAVDFSRLTVRSRKGTQLLSDLLSASTLRNSRHGNLVLSRRDLVVDLPITQPDPEPIAFDCERFSCGCKGDIDCNDMFSSGVCGDITLCDTSGTVTCTCLRF